MTTTLTEIKIPEAVQSALQARYDETGKLSSLNAKKLMQDVPGTSRVDAQIYIALFKDEANPIHPDTRIRRQIADIIAGHDVAEAQERQQMLDEVAALVY